MEENPSTVKKGLLIGCGCFPILIIGAFVFALLSLAAIYSGDDYNSLVLDSPLSTSEIQFIFGEEEVEHQVTDPDQAVVNTGFGQQLVDGFSIGVNDDTNIYAPFDGEVSEDEQNNIYVTGKGFRVYLRGVSLTVPSEFKAKKGDLIGTAERSTDIQIGLQEDKGIFQSKWRWISYYNQYLYWQTRRNVFPLLSPPDSKGNVKYRYSSPYGYRIHPVTGEVESFHNGLDIATPMYTKVLAVEDGTIVAVNSARDGNAGGNRMYLLSEDGQRKYAYMHLSTFLVKEGTTVRKGQKIALSGNTGRSTGPHLHFSFYDMDHNGDTIDPEPAVRFWVSNMDWEAYSNQE